MFTLLFDCILIYVVVPQSMVAEGCQTKKNCFVGFFVCLLWFLFYYYYYLFLFLKIFLFLFFILTKKEKSRMAEDCLNDNLLISYRSSRV